MNIIKQKPVTILSIVSAVFLIFSMLSLLIFNEQIFTHRNGFTIHEYIIALGIGLVVVFDFVSVAWLLLQLKKTSTTLIFAIIMGILCIILLAAEKTMIDEIGKEYGSEIETLSEWIMLYAFWAFQLLYNYLIFKTSKTNSYLERKFVN